jgi:hypothetical protein
LYRWQTARPVVVPYGFGHKVCAKTQSCVCRDSAFYPAQKAHKVRTKKAENYDIIYISPKSTLSVFGSKAIPFRATRRHYGIDLWHTVTHLAGEANST